MPPAAKDDGTDPEHHIWRLGRRDLLGVLGWGGVFTGLGIGNAALVRMLYPRVLFEPPTAYKIGRPNEYAPASVSSKWIKDYRFWLVRFADRFVAVSAICTHLGCTPRYLGTEDKFKCPCHGSGFRGLNAGWEHIAQNFEGPAPRPLERYHLSLADDGQILVDKGQVFRTDKGQNEEPGAFLPYS
ncbi:MAG: ubiquinol-cytochrome c reductase iron-sulfur subunit [Deltaproteobacteria bacterium]|nr:ubiquinol-cytochrome c reductase iron-sulfur subunit [Deltaproteobacteria bacterium]